MLTQNPFIFIYSQIRIKLRCCTATLSDGIYKNVLYTCLAVYASELVANDVKGRILHPQRLLQAAGIYKQSAFHSTHAHPCSIRIFVFCSSMTRR